MTAISRPPLAPLFGDNAADLFALFASTSGNTVPTESVVGFNSATMAPVVGIGEKSSAPGLSQSLNAAFFCDPVLSILSGRFNGPAGLPFSFIYRLDGRKFRSASVGVGFINAHSNGRVLTPTATAFATINPLTLISDSNDIAYALPAGMTGISILAGACDRNGNAACLFTPTGSGTAYKVGYWNAFGVSQWVVPFTPPGGSQITGRVQVEFDPAGAIYTLCCYSGNQGCELRQFAAATGAQNWSVAPNSTTTISVASVWITADGLAFVTIGPLTTGSNVFSYATASGAQQWSQRIGNNTAASVCELKGLLLVGAAPVSAGGAVTNLWQLSRGTGATVNQFAIGPTNQGYPYWLEPRAGRLGTFA
jgi:hypothetical protein